MPNKALHRFRVALLCTEQPEDSLAMQVVYCLKSMGVRVFLVSDGKENLYKYSRFVSKFCVAPFPIDLRDLNDFNQWLIEYIKRYEIDLVCGSDIFTTKLVARMAPTLHCASFFPVDDLETIEFLNDKWNFFQLLQRLELAAPHAIRLDGWTEESKKRVSSLAFPVMIKPLALSGGRGVVRFHEIEKVDKYLRQPHPFNEMPLLVQQYCPGRDIGLGFLADRGRLVAHIVQIKDKIPGFGQTVRFIDHPKAVSIGERIVAETRYTGLGFIDMRLDEDRDEIYALEFNPRAWFSIAVAMWQGSNFLEHGIRLAHGLDASGHANYRLGTFYSFEALRSRKLFWPSTVGTITKANLRGLVMEKSDLVALCYRRLRYSRQRRKVGTQPITGNIFWEPEGRK